MEQWDFTSLLDLKQETHRKVSEFKGENMAFIEKTAIVTGAAHGKGKAIAEALLKKNAKVCLVDVNADDLAEVKKSFAAAFGIPNVMSAHCDVTSESQIEDAFMATKVHFGRVDILVNAAVYLDEGALEKTIAVNLNGTMKATYAALKHLGVKGEPNRGLVVNISSILGVEATPFLPAYTAAHHGIVGFTRALGDKLNFDEFGIKVVCLLPGRVESSTSLEQFVHLCKLQNILAENLTKGPEAMSTSHFATVALESIEKANNGDCILFSNEIKPVTVPYKIHM